MTPVSVTSKTHKNISRCADLLVTGVVVSMDPSIGSSSSMPGYAVYSQGKLLESGTFSINSKWKDHERLQELTRRVRNLYRQYAPDVLVYEEIPPQRYGAGANAKAHSSLLKAVGAILSVPGPSDTLGMLPKVWKTRARDDYGKETKSDERDAQEIGWVTIELARQIREEQQSYMDVPE